jgi:hypothetical protein
MFKRYLKEGNSLVSVDPPSPLDYVTFEEDYNFNYTFPYTHCKAGENCNTF